MALTFCSTPRADGFAYCTSGWRPCPGHNVVAPARKETLAVPGAAPQLGGNGHSCGGGLDNTECLGCLRDIEERRERRRQHNGFV
jgi:hypothetical protein